MRRAASAAGRPTAGARLLAAIIACGLAWAIAVAIGSWVVATLLSRAG